MRLHNFCRLVLRLPLLLLLASCAPAFADVAPLPAGVTFVTEVEGIAEYRLDNGLHVLLFADASKPTLTVNVTYLVGSRHENYGETGMAHLLEHLMFKGTPTHDNIPQEFKERGARFNGTTWLDRTNYYELLPASDDNLAWAIALEADRMVNSFIARKHLDTEMTVVRNEFEMGENDPGDVLFKRLQSIAYDWHSYGRSTIGNRSDIENVRIENLQSFYHMYYQPDNAVLLVAGKFDANVALARIADTFGRIAKPQRVLPPFWTVEPTQDGERDFVVRRKADQQFVVVAYKMPSALHADAGLLEVAGDILGATATGRLHKRLVESGQATAVMAFSFNGYAPGLMIFGAVVKKGDPLEPVRDALIREVEDFAARPPTAQEVERVKIKSLKETERIFNDHEKIGVALSDYIALGDWRYVFLERDRIAGYAPEQVAAAAGSYLRRDNRTVGLFIPEDAPQRAEIPVAQPIAEIMKDFHGKARLSEAEAFEPSPANIQGRTQFASAGGLKVALLAKKNRGETVNVSISLHWGDEQTLFGKKTVSAVANGLIGRGTDKMNREQISDAMDKLKMSGGILAFQTTRDNLAAALGLVAHLLRDASFPASELEQLRKQMITAAEARRSDPTAQAAELLGRHFDHYPAGDWRHELGIDETIAALQAVTRDDVQAFHRDFFGASLGELAIVGDFDPASALKVLNEEFAAWKSKRAYAHILKQYFDIPPAHLLGATPDKENAVFMAQAAFELRDDAPDYPALMVANHVIGGGALDSRLGNRLRQKDGLSYGAGSWLHVPKLGSAANWGVYAIAAPQNMAKVEVGVKEELARALKDGFTDKEVAAAIDSLLKLRMQERAQDGNLAGKWTGLMFHQRDFTGWVANFDKATAAVTPASALAAARKYFDPAKLTIAIGADPGKLSKP